MINFFHNPKIQKEHICYPLIISSGLIPLCYLEDRQKLVCMGS